MTRLESLRKDLLEAEDKARSLKEKIRLADIDQLRRGFLSAGYHEDGEAWDYIKALEACRPWVIRNINSGSLMVFRNLYTAVFLSESHAKSYLTSVSSALTPDGWEVVQWEGNQ
jgi:hypothetical protein